MEILLLLILIIWVMIELSIYDGYRIWEIDLNMNIPSYTSWEVFRDKNEVIDCNMILWVLFYCIHKYNNYNSLEHSYLN